MFETCKSVSAVTIAILVFGYVTMYWLSDITAFRHYMKKADGSFAGNTSVTPETTAPSRQEETIPASKVDQKSSSTRPNILFILADDLGFSDVSWHDPLVKMPHLHRLASESVTLNSHYVQPTCTPTRAALLTGYYPIHTGSQGLPLVPMSPVGLYTNFTLLPQWLNSLGYRSHAVGKWHLGFCNPKYLPTMRGFSTFYGFWGGVQDYFSHKGRHAQCMPKCGYDFRFNEKIDRSARGTYSARLFGDRARKILRDHSALKGRKPFFIYLTFQNVHGPLKVEQRHLKRHPNSISRRRRLMLASISGMDDAVGQVVKELKEQNMYENTVIIFSSDVRDLKVSPCLPSVSKLPRIFQNGAPETCSSNYPLRGEKESVFEGGTRTAAFVRMPGRTKKSNRRKTYSGLFHVTDWLPTLYSAAGGDPASKLGSVDGVDQWGALRKAEAGDPAVRSPRNEMLYDIRRKKDLHGRTFQSAAIRHGDWKLVRDVFKRFDFHGDHRNCTSMNWRPNGLVNGRVPWRLFNISADPTESNDVLSQNRGTARFLRDRLETFIASSIPPHLNRTVNRLGALYRTGWCKSQPY